MNQWQPDDLDRSLIILHLIKRLGLVAVAHFWVAPQCFPVEIRTKTRRDSITRRNRVSGGVSVSPNRYQHQGREPRATPRGYL